MVCLLVFLDLPPAAVIADFGCGPISVHHATVSTNRYLSVDASVVVDLLGRFRPVPIETLLFANDTALASPALLDVEVLQALRRLDLQDAIPASRTDLIESLKALRIRRYPHASLIETIWSLRPT